MAQAVIDKALDLFSSLIYSNYTTAFFFFQYFLTLIYAFALTLIYAFALASAVRLWQCGLF